MSLDRVRDRLMETGLRLVAGRPRMEIATGLLGVIGSIERTDPTDEARADARDHLLEAALWLGSARPRETVAGAVLGALQALDTAAPVPAGTGHWNRRLSVWRGGGGISPRTRLLDWLLERSHADAGPLSAEETERLLASTPDEPDESLAWTLGLEVTNGRTRTFVPASEFRAIERSVRWTSGPDELYGLVGGKPYRVLRNALLYGGRAVRYRWITEELLIPFGAVRLTDGPA